MVKRVMTQKCNAEDTKKVTLNDVYTDVRRRTSNSGQMFAEMRF